MAKKTAKSRDLWHRLWLAQRSYNDRIRREQIDAEDQRTYWSKQYLLGLVSEVDEVLNSMSWKRHRRQDPKLAQQNIGLEIADLLKYVISLAEIWDISPDRLVELALDKSDTLQRMLDMEQTPLPLSDARYLICDLDGTIADWRQSFIRWATDRGVYFRRPDPEETLMLDVDCGLPYDQYNELKQLFELEGGYANLIPYKDGVETVKAMQRDGVYLVVYTARPGQRLKQIWHETYFWLEKHGIRPDYLTIGAEARLIHTLSLWRRNDVVMFEDNPELMLRAANSGIPVFARLKPYNAHAVHPNIRFVETYSPDLDYFSY